MNKTISDIIEQLDEIADDLDDFQHVPSNRLNTIKTMIDGVIQELEEISTEYGEECLDDQNEED